MQHRHTRTANGSSLLHHVCRLKQLETYSSYVAVLQCNLKHLKHKHVYFFWTVRDAAAVQYFTSTFAVRAALCVCCTPGLSMSALHVCTAFCRISSGGQQLHSLLTCRFAMSMCVDVHARSAHTLLLGSDAPVVMPSGAEFALLFFRYACKAIIPLRCTHTQHAMHLSMLSVPGCYFFLWLLSLQ